MSSLAIKVENLSKQYRIVGTREVYKTLRETLMNLIKAPFRRLKDLGRSIPKEDMIWALRDVSFEVKPGDVLGIIGRNGAGKTTLLKIFSRITEPTKGRVIIKGRVASLLEVGTGFHPELTGRENIYLNGSILGMKMNEIKSRFDEIVAFAEVEKLIDTPVKHYSSGMHMRLAFAVAAHLEPEILMIDEVLAVGDVAFQKKCLKKIGKITHEGRTVLFVSHNMAAIRNLCPKGLYLESGQILHYGTSAKSIDLYLKSNISNQYSNSLGYLINKKLLSKCKVDGLYINNVKIYNLSNPEMPIKSGDNILIRIYYKASRIFISPAFVFSFKDKNGVEILRLSNMPISGYEIKNLLKKGFIDLEIFSIPFVKGVYYVDIGFTRESMQWYFYIENLIQLNIEGKDIYGSKIELDNSRGLIWTNHSWSHRENEIEL